VVVFGECEWIDAAINSDGWYSHARGESARGEIRCLTVLAGVLPSSCCVALHNPGQHQYSVGRVTIFFQLVAVSNNLALSACAVSMPGRIVGCC